MHPPRTMNYDEFGFMNQQLAGMLRDGVPLEGALRQLCQTLHRGRLRGELERLEQDLTAGTPLREALSARQLPEFYRRMVLVGLEGQDLPGMLTLLADYYLQLNSTWTRLRGLMVYPAIVLVASMLLSIWLALVITSISASGMFVESPAQGRMLLPTDLFIVRTGPPKHPASAAGGVSDMKLQAWLNLWIPPALLTGVVSGTAVLVGVPRFRRWLRWRLPAFKEASLSQFATALNVLIRNGSPLRDALAVLGQLERGTVLGRELARWEKQGAAGQGVLADLMAESKLMPRLFRWLVASAGEDLATGLARAAEVYQRRALYHRELILNAALPMSLLFLGVMILGQVYPFSAYVFGIFSSFFQPASIVSGP